MKIEIEDKILNIDVQYGKRKKLVIQIDSVGLITVKAPKGTGEEAIKRVLAEKGQWIMEKLDAISKAKEVPKPRTFGGEGRFLYLGKEYGLHELIEDSELDEEECKRQLKRFYIASCKKIVGERIKIYEKQLGLKAKSIEVEESKVRWGSCSADKKLTFNYRLAMAPMEVIDYVIVHELCHLAHMNHDRSFWRLVGSVVTDYKEKQEFLARYGQYMTL